MPTKQEVLTAIDAFYSSGQSRLNDVESAVSNAQSEAEGAHREVSDNNGSHGETDVRRIITVLRDVISDLDNMEGVDLDTAESYARDCEYACDNAVDEVSSLHSWADSELGMLRRMVEELEDGDGDGDPRLARVTRHIDTRKLLLVAQALDMPVVFSYIKPLSGGGQPYDERERVGYVLRADEGARHFLLMTEEGPRSFRYDRIKLWQETRSIPVGGPHDVRIDPSRAFERDVSTEAPEG
jgi:hypothetical protein